jgi:hypothetical protein
MNTTNTGATTCRRCTASDGPCSEGSTSCSQGQNSSLAVGSNEAGVLVTLQLRLRPDELDVEQLNIISSAVALSFNLSKSAISIVTIQNITTNIRGFGRQLSNSRQDKNRDRDGATMKANIAKPGWMLFDFEFKVDLANPSHLRYALDLATANNGTEAGSASRIVLRVNIPLKSCAQLQGDLASILLTMRSSLQAGGLQLQSPITVEFVGCTSVALLGPGNQLTPDLRKHAESTTIVVATVVAAVVSTSVASATAGAVGMSIFSSGASAGATPGASIYQLINAVQFLNVYGSMLSPAKPEPNRRDLAVSKQLNYSTLNDTWTSSQASEFRCVTFPSMRTALISLLSQNKLLNRWILK